MCTETRTLQRKWERRKKEKWCDLWFLSHRCYKICNPVFRKNWVIKNEENKLMDKNYIYPICLVIAICLFYIQFWQAYEGFLNGITYILSSTYTMQLKWTITSSLKYDHRGEKTKQNLSIDRNVLTHYSSFSFAVLPV